MPLDDDKFNQLLLTIGLNVEDRKTLTRIEEKLSNHLDHYRQEQNELHKALGIIEQKTTAAHNRIDRIVGIGGWTVFLTISGLVLSVMFNLWAINEKRFERLNNNAYLVPQQPARQ